MILWLEKGVLSVVIHKLGECMRETYVFKPAVVVKGFVSKPSVDSANTAIAYMLHAANFIFKRRTVASARK
jgi:hypothetical protein